MKKIILIILVSLFYFSAKAQKGENSFNFALSAKQMTFDNYKQFTGFGFDCEFFLNDYISLNSRMYGGKDYFHAPATLLLFTVGMVYSGGSCCADLNFDDECFALAAIFAAEGISFHLPFSEELSIALYANPLGCDYMYDDNYQENSDWQKDNFRFTLATGVKMNLIPFERFLISSYIEYNKMYGFKQDGFSIGLNVGVVID